MGVTLSLFSVNRTARMVLGDSALVLPTLADASVDALCTDPPAGIDFMSKGWDSSRGGLAGWVMWLRGILVECMRVLKPGGHGLIWALPRTTHWTALAIELAGFEIRDRIAHLFGQGMPKSLDVSRAIDDHFGLEREVVGTKLGLPGYHLSPGPRAGGAYGSGLATHTAEQRERAAQITAPASPEAKQWEGWGTGLKPACEDWWLVRKPLDGLVAENVLTHGTGALNIDGCRIAGLMDGSWGGPNGDSGFYAPGEEVARASSPGGKRNERGRWPANVTLDEEAARMLDEQAGVRRSGAMKAGQPRGVNAIYGKAPASAAASVDIIASRGGASRFFYCAKATEAEKTAGGTVDNEHPTVKSEDLMCWLLRLITPPGGVVLDPFAGSGTTGLACAAEGFSFIGVELEEPSHRTAVERLRTVYGEVAA